MVIGAFLAIVAGLAPPSAGDEARTIYGALLAPYRDADAFEVEFSGVFAGSPEVIRAEYHLAKPLFGSILIHMGDPPTRAVADGTGLYFLDSTFETYQEQPGGLMAAPFLEQIAPFRYWASGKPPEPRSVKQLEIKPPNPALRAIEVEFGDHTEELWVDIANRLVAATIKMTLPTGDCFELSMTFEHIALLQDVRAEDYSSAIPEGYLPAHAPDETLIPIGELAPDVTFQDLEGNDVELDGLRGRTVYLDFWFYH